MFAAIPDSDCSLDDTECICSDKHLLMHVGGCMVANCTMQESLDTARVQAVICHLPNDSKSHRIFVLTIIVYAICFVFVAARTAGKVVSKRITMDDYIVVGTFLLAALPVGCALKST